MGPRENPRIAPTAHHGKLRASAPAKTIIKHNTIDNFSRIIQ